MVKCQARCEIRGGGVKALDERQLSEHLRLLTPLPVTCLVKVKGRPYGNAFFPTIETAQAFSDSLHGRKLTGDSQSPLTVTAKSVNSRKRNSTDGDAGEGNDQQGGARWGRGAARKRRQTAAVGEGLPKLLELKRHFQQKKFASGQGNSAVTERITPLSKFAYDDQIEMKRFYSKTCVKQLTRRVCEETEKYGMECVPSWCTPPVARGWHGCAVLPLLACAPEDLCGYRNKCEFTFGSKALSEGGLEVGYVVGKRGPEPVVHTPSGALHTSHAMQEVVCRMKYLVEKSRWSVFSRTDGDTGMWRVMRVRQCAATESLMVVIQIDNSTTAADEQELRQYLIRDLVGDASLSTIASFEETLSSSVADTCFPPELGQVYTPQSAASGVFIVGRPMYSNPPRHTATGLYSYAGHKVTSLYLQRRQGRVDAFDTDPFTLIYGEERLKVPIMGLQFEISPNSFFQTNDAACETLYSRVMDIVLSPISAVLSTPALVDVPTPTATAVHSDDRTERTHLLIMDICSGTGTISLALAARLQRQMKESGSKFPYRDVTVVGVEILEDAVADAVRNRDLNKSEVDRVHVSFICGKAESLVPVVLNKLTDAACITTSSTIGVDAEPTVVDGELEGVYKRISAHPFKQTTVIAVVDPPRRGLHKAVLTSILQNSQIDQLIYVSCNPESLVEDGIQLCGKAVLEVGSHLPFKPVCMQPIDMFPHTFHSEAVVHFRRLRSLQDIDRAYEEDDVNDTIQQSAV